MSAGRLLPCVKDLEPGEDELLGGQQNCVETNKVIYPTGSHFLEFLHRPIHMVASA
jgi:hypothetical protein